MHRLGAGSGGRRQREPTPLAFGILLAAMLLAACSPAIELPVLSAEASASPSSSGAAAGPSASAAVPGQTAAIAAFVKSVTGGTWTYRMAFTGFAAAAVDRLPIAGSTDVSGPNFASSFTYDYSRVLRGVGKVRIQVREVGRKGYAKVGGAAWQALSGYGKDDSNVPFAAVETTDDITLLGSTKVAGRVTYRVSIPNAVLIHPSTILGNISVVGVGQTTLELVIDDQGRPVAGDWRLTGKARVGRSGQLQELVYELQLTFTRVGAKITIARP